MAKEFLGEEKKFVANLRGFETLYHTYAAFFPLTFVANLRGFETRIGARYL